MRTIKCFVFILLISAIFLQVCGFTSNTINEDLTLTYPEKMALDKFKARVKHILPHRYMREDSYLINWLRAKDFQVSPAEKFLKQNLKWRKQNKVDTIHGEDFSDLLAEYPVHVDTYDKNGAPVITGMAGNWDLRQAALFGYMNRVQRLVIKMMDEASIKVRKAQLQGKQVTRFQFVLNLQGFNLAEHGCPICLIEIVRAFQNYENYFPGMAEKMVIFNAPPSIQIIRPYVREILSGRTRANIKIIGRHKSEWQKALMQFIDGSQLTKEFGGTRIRNSTSAEY